MRNKKIMIPALVVAFLLAGAGTVFVMMKIKGSTSEEPQQTEETAPAEEETPTEEEKPAEGEKKEEKPKTETIEEKNKKVVEKQNACNKLREEMNAAIRKEDNNVAAARQKASTCTSGDCTAVAAKVEADHNTNLNKIMSTYQKKWKDSGCAGNL